MLVVAYPAFDPVALQIGPLAIRWYGLAYFVSILIGWWYVRRLVTDGRLWGARPPPMTLADADDLLLWMTLGVIVGGRLGNVLFYDPGYYLRDPLAVLRLWEGGMAFHGGLIGTILAMTIFGRRRRIPVLSLFDVAAAATPIGLFFGRIANFVNGELWGRPSSVPWAMVFPEAGPEPRHPSQLYEALLEGVLLFLILRVVTHMLGGLQRPGLTGGIFIAGYGVCRIISEFFREPDPRLEQLSGFLTMGMVLSAPMVLIGIFAAIWAARRTPA
jgi:phosphatidylglycerol:prolipoprotein diacylglycerol transferase